MQFDAQQFRVVFAERVRGLERHRELVADFLALERRLDLGEHSAESAVQVIDAGIFAVQERAVAVAQFVGQRHHAAVVNSPGH